MRLSDEAAENLLQAALDWAEIDELTSPPCTAEMLKASDIALFTAVREYARQALASIQDPKP